MIRSILATSVLAALALTATAAHADVKAAAKLASDGKIAEARAALKAELAKAPSAAVAAELGRNYIQYPPVEAHEAITLLLPVIDAKKNGYGAKDPDCWITLARAFLVDKQYPSAATIYRKYIKEVKKDDLRAYTGLADAQILANQFKEANDTMDEAQRLFPDNPDVLFYVGRVKERDGRLRNASILAGHYYQNAARISAQSNRYFAAAMFAFLNAGDTTSALAVYNELRAKSPQDSYVLWFDGLNEELGFKMPQAIALYEKAVSSNPENVYALYVLARLYLGVGNKSLRVARGVEPPEGFRVAPFRNYARGNQLAVQLKYLDPSFPGAQALAEIYNRSLSKQSTEQNMTPEQKVAVEQLINYTVKMNRYR